MRRYQRRSRTRAITTALVAVVTLLATFAVPRAAAAPGDGTGQPLLTTKTVDVTEATGGDLITYEINFTCSNTGDDGCDGTVFTDPLPTFTDIYGNEIPVEFVDATFPATVFPDGFTVNDSVDPPVVTATAGTWPPGTSGTIQITVLVPPGVVPPGTQTLTNQASVTDPDDGDTDPSDAAETTIDAPEPDWEIEKTGPSEIRADHEYTWLIRVCPVVPNASLPPVIDVTDLLPPGFQYTSSNPAGTFTDDGTPDDGISDGAATVTWHFDEDTPPPPFDADGCFVMEVTGEFPSDYEVDGQPVNGEGETKTNTASGSGGDDDFGEDDSTGTLSGPQFAGSSTSKDYTAHPSGADDFYVQSGDVGRFNLGVSVDSDFPLDSIVLEDGTWSLRDSTLPDVTDAYGMPDSFLPTELVPGSWNDPVTATIQGRDLATDAWTDVATDVASGGGTIALTPATTFRAYRWVWDSTEDITGQFDATGIQIVGTVGEPEDDFGRYIDTATATVVPIGATGDTSSDSDEYVLEDPTPDPGITKAVDEGTRQPGQAGTFTITLDNSADATDDLDDPVVQDCMPAEFVVVAVTAAAPWEPGPALSCDPAENAVSLQWAGTLTPGQSATPIEIDFEVRTIENGGPADVGTYVNTATVVPDGGGSFAHCQNQDPDCADTAAVIVPATVQLDSRKCVSGELDGGIFRPTPACDTTQGPVVSAQTTPGGIIDYRLELTNVGNTPATNIQVIDILPHEGDTSVVGDPVVPRFSEFNPFLLTPLEVSPGWIVEYSVSANPCRPEVGGPTTGCAVDPGWTATPDLLELSSYRSIRVTFNGVLDVGVTGTFTWRMRAPVEDDTYDTDPGNDDPYEFLDGCSPTSDASSADHCPRAQNSFAYGADPVIEEGEPSAGRLFAEPPQVEVRVTEPPPPNSLGDQVWFDWDFDGIQDFDDPDHPEVGLPNVRVELWGVNNTVPLAQTFTDADGLFLFGFLDRPLLGSLPLPDGTYHLRFYPEPGWYVSPQDVVPPPGDAGVFNNSGNDSDLPQTPVAGAEGDYHLTVEITLDEENNFTDPQNPGEADLSWDLGLWTAEPEITIVKDTKDDAWSDAEYGDDVLVVPGRDITWRYVITNTGNTRLEDVTVDDDVLGEVTGCTITEQGQNGATPPLPSTFVDGVAALNRGAEMVCTASGTSGTEDYDNVGSVVGTPVFDDGSELDDGPGGTPPPGPVEAEDPSSYTPLRYDLALAKTVADIDLVAGTASFTIVVENQGNVVSGDYTVSDQLPPGLEVTGTSPAATTTDVDASGTFLTWDLTDLAVGGQQEITIDVQIDDYGTRPWRNVAEISEDGADDILTGDDVPTPTTDDDSTIDEEGVDFTNDGDYGPVGDASTIDNQSIADAGVNGGDTEDDADIADLDPEITYDLALAKIADSSPIGLGEDPSYTFRVYNQGNVPSGPYTVRDQLPTGLSFDPDGSPDTCAAEAGNQVVCSSDGLDPGTSESFTIATTIDTVGGVDDLSTAPWQNWAEIDTDSADDLYSAPNLPVADTDSTPESDQQNGVGLDDEPPAEEDVIDVTTADETYSGPDEGDEDDNDFAVVESSVIYDLRLIKTVAVEPPTQTADGTATYTITVNNQGTVDSGLYDVTDVVPAGLEVTDADGGAATVNGDGTTTIVWADQANLEPGTSTTFTIEATVVELTDRPYRNFAEISADEAEELYVLDDVDSTPDADATNDGTYGDIGESTIDNIVLDDAGEMAGDLEDDADIADFTFPVDYDLALAKTVDADVVEYDDVITYTITVLNQGVVDSHEFTVEDIVPEGLTVVPGSISDDGSLVGDTITWVVDDLEPAATVELTFEATISDITQRPFRNQAEITADSADDYSVDGDEVLDGDSTPDTDPDNDGTYGPIGASTIDNLTISDAGIIGGDPQDDADIADVDVDVRYDLALIKTGPATMDPLGSVVFSVTVENQGNVPSGPYAVTDQIPAGLIALSASDGGTITTTTVTWTTQTSLDPGGTRTFLVTMQADSIPDGLTQRPFTNVAEITDDSADTYTNEAQTDIVEDFDSDPGDAATSTADNTTLDQAGGTGDEGFDDEDIAVVTTDVVYDLALIKTTDPLLIDLGETATFTITVANQGNVPSGLYTVTDELPSGLVPSNISGDGDFALLGRTITWADQVSLDPGATATFTFDVTISDITDRPWVNFAEITADSAATYDAPGDPVTDEDSVPGDDATSGVNNVVLAEAGVGRDTGFDDEDIAILAAPVDYDLALIKTGVPEAIPYDGTATFTITVVNQGDVPSHEVEVTDVVPDGLVASNISSGGVLGGDGSTITWTIDDIAVDGSVELTFDVTIDDMTTRPWLNVAEITADGSADFSSEAIEITDRDSVPGDTETSDVDNTSIDQAGEGDDEGFDDEDVAPLDSPVVYDLAIDKRLLPDQSYAVGDPVVYEVEVTNQGNVPSGPYTFIDTLPPGTAFVSASDGGTASGQVVTWADRPSLLPGASAIVTVTATITDPTLSEYRNWVQITVDSADDYDTSDIDVEDVDSVPDDGEQGEDDDDFEVIPPGEVAAANAEALPRTGSDPARPVGIGLILLVTGAALALVARRRLTTATHRSE